MYITSLIYLFGLLNDTSTNPDKLYLPSLPTLS